MRTIHEVSQLTGVSVRTLHYYDSIKLFTPTKISDSGYRLYDDESILKLQNILLFKEIGFSLKEISDIVNSPDYDINLGLSKQIEMLESIKNHINDLITFTREIKTIGVDNMDFSKLNSKDLKDYSSQAKILYGKTDSYKEYEEKSKNRKEKENQSINEGLMNIFIEFGKLNSKEPESQSAQKLVKDLKDYITKYYYNCTNEILSGLGKMYIAGGSMTDNIDNFGGKGTALFVNKAIEYFLK